MAEKNNIRVGHMVNQLGPSTAAGDLTTALNKYSNIDSVVISIRDPENPKGNIPVLYPSNYGIDNHSIINILSWLKEIITGFDVIISHHTFSGILGSIVAKFENIPIIAREGNDHQRFSFRVRATRTLINLLCDKVVCVSQSVSDSYQGFESIVPKSKFQVINNGVDVGEIDLARQNSWDLHSYTNIEVDSKVIGTAGMLIKQKNHELLLNSIKILVEKRGYNVHLVIAGDGPLYDELKQRTQELNISKHTHFLGYLQRMEVYKMFHQIDVYAMPSKWEGFSAAALQAMAVGVPCVFSNIPSFTSQYPDDFVYFHDPESVVDLANALENALSNRKDVDDLGRKFILNNYTIEIMAKNYAKIIQELHATNTH